MRLTLLGATALLAIGCASLLNFEDITTTRDEYRGYTYHRLTGNILPGGGSLLGLDPRQDVYLELNAQKFVTDSDSTERYDIVVAYSAPNWLFIREGQSLSLIVDGEVMQLRGNGSAQHRQAHRGGGVTERAYYQVSVNDLRRIGSATEARVRVDGSQKFIERTLAPKNIANIARFVQQHGGDD
jgi:hypothetical protein